jgi:16S rRNA (guanine966-N2)-methyltransferase
MVLFIRPLSCLIWTNVSVAVTSDVIALRNSHFACNSHLEARRNEHATTTSIQARMRIVGGKFAGRDLTSPNDFRVRPTAEHVRAALLDMLKADIPDARVLDLFAGTGALGLEALSRGARTADFVETRPASLHALRANVAALRGMRDCTRIFKRDALPYAASLEADRYDIAFVDPPYGSKMLDRVIESWMERRFSRVLAVEHEKTHVLPRGYDKRLFEESGVTIYRA